MPSPHQSAFHLDPAVAFLNHGSFGATPRAVVQARESWMQRMETQPVAFMMRDAEPSLREAAFRVARFVGADAEGLVFVDNATSGVNTVLRDLPWRAGDRIVVLSHVYGAVNNAVHYIAERFGAQVVTVDVPFPLYDLDALLTPLRAALAAGAALAVLDHITSPTGLVLPIDVMVDLCKEHGVPVLVDGAHAPGQVHLDLQALGADWYTGNLHKWAFAPKGTAVIWVHPDRRDLQPLTISHGMRGTLAQRFDWTGTRDLSAWCAAPVGLELHDGWGGTALMARNHALCEDALDLLVDAWGVDRPARDSLRAAMGALPVPGDLPADLETALRVHDHLLDAHKVEVPVLPFAERLWVRISAQIYNSLEDYQRLAEAMPAAVQASGTR